MKIYFCYVSGGVHNYDFYGYLTENGIKYYKDYGCKATKIEWSWKIE